MAKQLDSLIHDFLTNPIFQTTETNYPPYNVFFDEENQTHVVELAVAGWKPDQIKVDMDLDSLKITGTSEPEPDGVRYFHRGIGKRNFLRSFKVGASLDRERIDVMMTNGILKISIPLKKEDETKTLKIKVV